MAIGAELTPLVEDSAPESASADMPDRVAARSSVFLRAEVELGGQIMQGNIRNLSATGARIDLPITPGVGEIIHVTIRNIGRIPGKTVWCRDGQVGICFETTIVPDAAFPRRPINATDQKQVAVVSDYRRPGVRIMR